MNPYSRWLLCLLPVFVFSAGYSNVKPGSSKSKVFGIASHTSLNNDLKPVARQVFEARASRNEFKVQSPLAMSRTNETFNNGVKKSAVLTLETPVLEKMYQDKSEFIELRVQDSEGKVWKLDLIQSTSITNDFVVRTSASGGQQIFIEEALFYRGVVQGDYNSVAAFSIFEGNIIGMITSDEGNMVLHPLENEEGTFIFYNDDDLNADIPFSCSTDDLEWSGQDSEDEEIGSRALSDCVRVYIECDYALYQNKGSNVTNVVNWITAVYNNVATLYANEDINTAISEVFVWNTNDPYSKTSASTALNQFRNLRTNINGDLAHLAALGGNNLGGVAWVNALCSTYKYAYSNISSNYQSVPTYSWTVMVMTHEMGHNLGSNHTQWCGWSGGALDNCYQTEGSCGAGPAPVGGGTIMSYCHLTGYGINLNNGFGTQPGNKIRSRVAAVTCLSASCTSSGGGGGGTCNTPTELSSSNITTNSATVSWNAVSGATSYIFQYKLATSSIWSQTTISGTVANFSSLTPSTSYNCRVRAVCQGNNSEFSSILTFTTLGNTTCTVPGGLSTSNITLNSAVVTWAAVSGAVSYNVQYKLATSGIWTELNTTGTSMSLTSLLSTTVYNWRVQAVCSGGSSSFSAFLSFTTLNAVTCNIPAGLQSSGITATSVNLNWNPVVGALSYIVEYKLASASIWSQQNASNSTTTINSLVPNSVYNWRVRTVCVTGNSAFSSTLNFITSDVACNIPSGLNSSNITATSANLSWTAVNGASSYIVEYKLSTSGNWSQQDAASNNTTISSLIPNSLYNWRVRTVCGSNNSAFSATSNFTTLTAPSCGTPSGLVASNITASSASLSWASVSGASSYTVEYKLSGAGNWSQQTASGNSTVLSSLLSNSVYDWRVQANCGGNSSPFSTASSFTTAGGGACNTPTLLNSSNVTATTATLSWTSVSGASSYNVEYKISNAGNWTSVSSTTNSVNLTGLTPSSQYGWRVQSVCGGNSSAFSYNSSFRTSLGGGNCGIPSGLSTSNITASSAILNWNAVSGAVSYTIEYKLSSSGTWTPINLTGTSTNLTSLLSNSTYNVRIQAICSGSSSAFSSSINFTTLSQGSSCNAPGGLNASAITSSSATISWIAVSGAVSYNVEYKLASSGSWSSTNVSGTNVNLSSLSTNSNYNVRVQTVCNGNSSSFSTILNFTTLNTGSSCNIPSGLNATNVTSTQALVSWSAVAGSISYTLEYKLASSSIWIPVSVTSTSHTLTSLTPNSNYNYRVRTICASSSSSFSPSSSFTTGQDQSGSGYCNSSGQNASIEWISRVAVTSINRISGSDGGYFDATSMTAQVPRGRSQTLIHRASFNGSPRMLYWRMWIDLNQDGDFNDPGEMLVSKTSSSDNDQYASFLIPYTALLGPTRMRIQAKYGSYGTPCETFANGEVEDYTIDITNLFGLPAAGNDAEISIISNIKMFPNPVSEDLNILFQSAEYLDMNIQIVDLLGRVLIEEKYYVQEGDNRVSVTVSDLNTGPYVLILKNGNMVKNYRFIKAE